MLKTTPTKTPMTNLTNEQIKDDLRDRLYCIVDPDGDEIITLEQAAEEILLLRQKIERLEATTEALESLRPQWAKGYSSDSVAAQTAYNALTDIWEMLGVTSQTEAMTKLQEQNNE